MIEGAGTLGVLMETLSKVAVATAEPELLALTAKPINTFWAIEMVCVEPSWVQFTPSGETKLLKLLPLRTTLTQ